MTTNEIIAALFRAGVRSVRLEATPHANVIRLHIGPGEDAGAAVGAIDAERALRLTNAWHTSDGALHLRVEMET